MRSARVPFAPRRGERAEEAVARALRELLPRGWKVEVDDVDAAACVHVSRVVLSRLDADGDVEEVAWGAVVSDLGEGGGGWAWVHVGAAEDVPGFGGDGLPPPQEVRP